VGAKSGVVPGQAAAVTAGRTGGRWRWVAGTVAAAAVLMCCYLRIAGDTQVNSDGSGLVWQAWAVLHGNVLLHGWWATDVSFYTTELPEYVVVTAVAGLRPEVVHICSALTYTALVLLAAFVARGRARGPEGVVRALLAAGLILAPQPTGPTLVLVGNPDHVGTGVPVLVLLLLLDWGAGRRGRTRMWIPVAAAVLLGWSIIGDPLIEVVGVVPLFAACVLRAIWIVRTGQRPGADATAGPRRPWSGWPAASYELSLAAAAVAAVLLAMAGNRLIKHLGGLIVASPSYHLQSLHKMIKGLPVVWQSVLALFDADYSDVHSPGEIAFAVVHLIGVAVVLIVVVVALGGVLRPLIGLVAVRLRTDVPGDLVADILVLAIAANFAALLLEVSLENIYASHEIGPVLAFGAALAGRTLGGRIVAGRRAAAGGLGAGGLGPGGLAAAGGRPSRRGAGRILLPAFAVVLACYAVTLGFATAHRQVAPRNVGLAAWLQQHHLTRGLAPYWEATSVTVDTGGAVTLVGVTDGGWHGHVTPEQWETDVALGAPAPGRSANFVITSPAEKVHRPNVLATFGRPARSYRYGPYTIMVWDGNLLPRMAASAAPPRARTVSLVRPD
jgi:hypothetical protein